jgi:hypothetical protein
MRRAVSVTVCETGTRPVFVSEQAPSHEGSRTWNSAYESVTSAHADERMRTSPSYRRTGQETDMDMTVTAIGAVVASGSRDAGSRKLFICN